MFYPQTEFISGGNSFWLKEKLFALKAKFLSAIASVVPEPHSAFFGRDNCRGERESAQRFAGKIQNNWSGAYCCLVWIQHNNCGGNHNAVFQFLPQYLAISGGVIGVILFAIMTGASATVLRASIMALLALTEPEPRAGFILFLGRCFWRDFYGLAESENFKI